MGKLERKLDLDLIARMKAGTVHAAKPLKHQSSKRPEWTYRAYWRNANAYNGKWRAGVL